MEPEHIDFARRLHQLRMEKCWTMRELAIVAGLSRDDIRDYALGRSLPTLDNLGKLAAAFDVAVDELEPKEQRNARSN